VLSPWNNGSGFGAKDKEPLRVLERISRTRPEVRSAAGRDPAGSRGRREGHAGQVQPGAGLPQPLPGRTAAVDRRIGRARGREHAVPPLLGHWRERRPPGLLTNFHQRLLEVIGPPRSLARARDLLAGTETEQLASAAIGQFNPAGAAGPGSSRFGAADSLVNPWG